MVITDSGFMRISVLCPSLHHLDAIDIIRNITYNDKYVTLVMLEYLLDERREIKYILLNGKINVCI